MNYSVIVPVYKNEHSIPELIESLSLVQNEIASRFNIQLEAIFVVDGSPDQSAALLSQKLPEAPFASKLLLHTRNFGSFAAIRSGLNAGQGPYFGMIAADLQEPPSLLVDFLEKLVSNTADIVVGTRQNRDDPPATRLFASLFWWLYRLLVIRDIPEGGVDLFACTDQVRRELSKLGEAHSSLVGLVYWVGFRRCEIAYSRSARKYGRSAWTFRRKLAYMMDSVFSFTDLPIRILTAAGLLGIIFALLMGVIVFIARVFGDITVTGYATTLLVIVFFGALNTLGIGLVGHYAWRTYENTKHRPLGIVSQVFSFSAHSRADTSLPLED